MSRSAIWREIPYPGRPPLYTPEELWDKFVLYMSYNRSKYWEKEDFIKSGPGAGSKVSIEIPNMPSIMGFCLYAGMSEDTFRNYSKRDQEYMDVWIAVRYSIQEEQIAGGASNTFNANIVSRAAGLIDKKEVDVKTEMTDDERTDTIKAILEKIKKE